MKATVNIGSVTMPAGEYFVGDPCYSVPNDRWMEWLEAADYKEEPRYLLADIDGDAVLGIGTAFGDGEYLDESGNSYPVDAGLIGLVPVSIADPHEYFEKTEAPWGTHREMFHHPFECSYDDGYIVLGNIRIDTEQRENEGW